ncbi:MAG: hypothetical protein JNL92_05745 [Opitutaceae bacterium]|nr:hypothetical protein [Opitutaceae bacterium]
MFSCVRHAVVCLALATTLPAQSALENARAAQALLGPGVWSRTVTVENEARRSPYPKIVHALVFELAGILWFYTDADGTQSFSLHVGNLAAEKADFGPLLRAIEPGFTRWTETAPETVAWLPAGGGATLRNGCFIESVAALRERMARGEVAEEPRLLSYHALTREGRVGHTVLSYRAGGRIEILDPARRERTFDFPVTAGKDPLVLARALAGRDVAQARYVPLPVAAIVAGLAVKSDGRT